MTKEELMKKLIFESGEEKNDAEFYIRVKGVAIHQKIMTHIGVDFSHSESTIQWLKVSALLRYDKKLREKIYIYIATLEEYLRAYISNKYENMPNQTFWQDGRIDRAKVKTRILGGEKVSDVLQTIEFGDLMNQIKNLSSQDIEEMFDYTADIGLNLDAVRELRNAVSHHAFLMEYKFKRCTVENKQSNSLEHNIKNLRQLLPTIYRYGKNGRGGITGEIENCQFEFKKDNNVKGVKEKMRLDENDIVSML